MKDSLNRARWSREQRTRAGTAFAASLPSAEQDRAATLAGLRQMAEMLETMPHMAQVLAQVRAQIAQVLLAQIDLDLASVKRTGDRIDAKLARIDEILDRIEGAKDETAGG